MSINRFTFNYGTIKSMLLDSVTNTIWLFFNKTGSGRSHIVSVSANDLYSGKADIEVSANSIIRARQDTTYLYVAYNGSTILGARYNKSNPFSDFQNCGMPIGINEEVVSLAIDSSRGMYFLTPGTLSAENAKIYVYNSSCVYVETIDLGESGKIINNAVDITCDTNDNLWVITNDSPSKLVRVYFESGGWKYAVSELSVIT